MPSKKVIDILVIGGGFAGVSVVQDLAKSGKSVLLVDKKDYFEVTFATLRNLASPQTVGDNLRKRYSDFLTSEFIQSAVKRLTPNYAELDNGQTIHFQQAIIATGSSYPSLPMAKSTSAMTITERNNEMQLNHQKLVNAKSVLIIGGGIVGVELAGEIISAFPDKQITLSHIGDTLLDGFKPKAQQLAQKQLEQQGVRVLLQRRFEVTNESTELVCKQTQDKIQAELVLPCIGVSRNNQFLQQDLADIIDESGLIKVNKQLQVEGHKNLYALGDCSNIPEAKLGYLANEQGKYLAKQLTKKKTKAYKPHPLMALIPVGSDKGFAQLPFAVTTTKLIMNMKQKDLFISKTYKGFGTQPDL